MISIQTVSCLEKILPNKPYDAEKRGSKLQNEHYAFQVVVEGGRRFKARACLWTAILRRSWKPISFKTYRRKNRMG